VRHPLPASLTDRRIKYSTFSVTFITGLLTLPCIIFIKILTDAKTFGLTEIAFSIVALVFISVLVFWTINFLIPLFIGRPGLIITPDALYISSIDQSIPWTEIASTKIRMTKNNHVVSIFAKDEGKVFKKPSLIVKRFACALNAILYSTPFGFSTFPLVGRAIDIYNDLKSAQTMALLTKPAGNSAQPPARKGSIP
jgi:hypothetical protein